MQHNKIFDETGCYYASIDIGTSNIKTVVGRQTVDGKIEIVAADSTPTKGVVRGDIRNTNEVVASIAQSIERIESNYGVKILQAYVGLSGQHIKFLQKDGYVSINNKDGEVTCDDVIRLSKEMNNITIPAGEAIIHILPQSYCIDDDADVIEPIGMVGNRLNGVFNIITGDNSRLVLVKRCLNRAGVDMSTIILSSLASAEAVLDDDTKELGVIVVDIGGGTTDICIYHDKTMRYLGVIPIGGEVINRDIRAMGVLERLVEKLKIKFGSAFSDNIEDHLVIKLQGPSNEILQKDLAMAIEARVMDIIEELERMIDSAGFTNKLKGGIILTGGCSQLKDIDKLFARHFGCEVRVAKPDMYVTGDSIEKVDSPAYTTSVGLLLRAATIGATSKLEFIINTPEPQPQPQYPHQMAYGATNHHTTPMTQPQSVTPPQPQPQSYKPQPVEQDTKTIRTQVQQPTAARPQHIEQPVDDTPEYEEEESSSSRGNVFRRFVDSFRKVIDPGDDDLEDNKL